MKTYQDLRPEIKTGDVVLVKGEGLISKLIRAFSGESISHVGMFLVIDEGVFIIEFKEMEGFKFTPASLRLLDLAEGGQLFYGTAPEILRNPKADKLMNDSAFSLRQGKYGYLTLMKIWWAQMTKSDIPVNKVVCSTYVQRNWKAGGYEMSVTADPGNISEHCQTVQPIKPTEVSI